ncbi:hypothetical protein BJ322DRAFT_1059185 [Thelephora terrestris]|uniref:Uncharacterized protein n=1 Tax=Thelephora terrestris TaxID=56493 RepID=A0A9P6HGM2_9AGAM|nr:hypothetical protein BJ322DRAFT_1059185 [Thelephora terrestris]
MVSDPISQSLFLFPCSHIFWSQGTHGRKLRRDRCNIKSPPPYPFIPPFGEQSQHRPNREPFINTAPDCGLSIIPFHTLREVFKPLIPTRSKPGRLSRSPHLRLCTTEVLHGTVSRRGRWSLKFFVSESLKRWRAPVAVVSSMLLARSRLEKLRRFGSKNVRTSLTQFVRFQISIRFALPKTLSLWTSLFTILCIFLSFC